MHSIVYQGILRMNRAIALNILIPNNELIVTASSEIISVLGPYINPKTRQEVIGTCYAIIYAPKFSKSILDIYTWGILTLLVYWQRHWQLFTLYNQYHDI